MAGKDKDKPQVEPSPRDPELAQWLEGLFDGNSEFPQKIELNSVSGPNDAEIGSCVDQFFFTPERRLTKEEKKEARADGEDAPSIKSGRPTREELVELSNKILALIQRDCDARFKTTKYGVHAVHLLRSPDPYKRFLIRCTPKGKRKSENSSYLEGDEEELNLRERYDVQKLHHNERFFNLMGSMFEGFFDRQDRALERSEAALEKTRQSNERLVEMLEKLQSNQHEREMKLRWEDTKIKAVEKGLDMAIGVGTPLLSGLIGNKRGDTIQESPESMALKMFFKLTKDGGRLTLEQLHAAIGLYDDTPECNLLKPGVLTAEQGELLVRVARLELQANELDRLLPGGDLSVTPEQFNGLMKVFPDMTQLTPLFGIFQARQSASQNRQNGASASS